MQPSKENRAFCERQIARLEALNFFQTLSVVGLTELRDALMVACATPQQAELVMSTWIADNSEKPTPADIHKIARTMNAAIAALPEACEECASLDGYVRREVRLTRGVFAGELRDALVPCSCALGETRRGAWRKLHQDDVQRERVNDLQKVLM